MARVASSPATKYTGNGLVFSGGFTSEFDAEGVSVTVDAIQNNSTSRFSGRLRVELWSTWQLPVRDRAFSGQRIATFDTLAPLAPGGAYRNLRLRGALNTQAQPGTFWIVLVLSEYFPNPIALDTEYAFADSIVSAATHRFGSLDGLFTMISGICIEAVPDDVAVQLEARGFYRLPATNSCASNNMTVFVGYLAGQTGFNTYRVYALSLADAADLCRASYIIDCALGAAGGLFTDLYWNPKESGWGVTVTHHGSGIAFVTWYTYDATGNPKWYVASDCRMAGLACSGTIYETKGPPFGSPFDPAAVTVREVGTLSLEFSGYYFVDVTMQYELHGQKGTASLTRQPF